MSPDQEYTIVVNGKPQGPYSLAELKNLSLTPNSFVRKPGMDDYKEAHEIPELQMLLGFDFQKTAPQYFAAFDQRLLATAIDHFLIFIIYIVLVLIGFIFIEDKSQRIIAVLLPFPSIFIVKLIYGSFAEATAGCATIGKKLVGIKVTDLKGNQISLGTSALRNFSKIFSILPAFFGYFYSFLNKKNQCWHDLVSNTLVIKERLI